MMTYRLFAAALAYYLFLPILAAKGPVKVFLLAGQSNMVGMGSMKHLNILVNQSSTNEFRRALWNETSGDFKERNDVYVKYGKKEGKLAPGHGFGGRNNFGPELMFGWTVGDAYRETVYLIKTAYGGRNLAVDFRPPSSGEGNYPGVKPHKYGWEYRQMVFDYLDAIDAISSVIPDYDEDVGYELVGFVWFQGWNDMLNWPMVEEYGENLANFIRDIRLDFDVPELPVIVGELGMHGVNPPQSRATGRIMRMRASERSVTLLNEFRNSTRFVRTAPFAVLNGTHYNGVYHYNGRADTYFHIGEAFGKGMLELIGSMENENDDEIPEQGDYSFETFVEALLS